MKAIAEMKSDTQQTNEIKVAVQSWLWVRVELMASYIYIYIILKSINILRTYSRPILHSTIECCPLLQRFCKALFWCKILRKEIQYERW